MTDIARTSTNATNQLQPLKVAALTAGGAAAASFSLHAALNREMWKHPAGGVAHKFWTFREGGVGRGTLGATIMMGAIGLGVGELKGNGLTPDSKLGTAVEMAGAGAAIGGAMTWCGPLFHGRQLGTPRSMMVNMALGAVVGSIVNAVDHPKR
jgi:hypothetical protein